MKTGRILVVILAGMAATLVGLASSPAQAGLIGGGNMVNALFFLGAHISADEEFEDFGSPPVVGPAPIGSGGVDFAEGALDLSSIHVGDTTITINNMAPSSAPFCAVMTTPCPDSFTGFEFQFSSGVDITGVTVDPASASDFQPIAGGLSFTATDILVNVAGDAPNPGDDLILNLTFAQTVAPPTVPEPASLLLLGAGVLGIVGARRARTRSEGASTHE
jgi:hypothetical protein